MEWLAWVLATFLAGPLVGRWFAAAGRVYPTPGAGAAMATKQFTTSKRDTRTITFNIDDDEYHFAAPKLASVMLPVLDAGGNGDGEVGQVSMGQATWDWLREGLGDEQYARIRARLEDPDDGLDVVDVAEVARWLVGKVSGRPTS